MNHKSIRVECLFLSTGLVASASQEEGTTRRINFLHRKPSRNYRTKATQKPTPATITEGDDDEEIRTSPQCPEPDGYFADSEQCDKYYACRYGNMCTCVLLLFCVYDFIFLSHSLARWICGFNLLQWHCLQQTCFLSIGFYHIFTYCKMLLNSEYALHWIQNTHIDFLFVGDFEVKLMLIFVVQCFILFNSDGVMTEKLCPDGMVFNDYDKDVEKCDLPYNIDCEKRPKLRKCYLWDNRFMSGDLAAATHWFNFKMLLI